MAKMASPRLGYITQNLTHDERSLLRFLMTYGAIRVI